MLDAGQLIEAACSTSGLDDFGEGSWYEGLERLTKALSSEADLTELGREILGDRLQMLLVNRLGIEATYRTHPEIADQTVEGPLFIIGLPRTGTTALSNLLATDPQIRSLRLWESSAPVPPPEADTADSDPRIAATQAGLDTMYEVFPRMRSLYHQVATGPTECQDLLGMELRTTHFDGMAHVPSYVAWAVDCDMAPAYRYHRRTLRLLQWHCPPHLWHLKTPVHMLTLEPLLDVYPDARFLWTHRDPAEVLGSVCDLIAYTRSWVSDRDDRAQLGNEQVDLWSTALRRAIEFRDRIGETRFADVDFGELNADPVGTVRRAGERLGVTVGAEAQWRMAAWAGAHPQGGQGSHDYALGDFGLDRATVRDRFGFYVERFDLGCP